MEIRRRTGFVSDDKDLYDYMTVERDDPLHRRVLPALARRPRAAVSPRFELPPDRKVKALSRGMRTKLALLLALCRGAELLILDEPTSGLDPAMTEEVLQALVGPRGQRGDDGLLLLASDRRGRSDRRPRRDHRSRPRRRGRCARRPAGELPPHPAGVRRRRAGGHVPRAGRRARAAQGPRADRAVERRGRSGSSTKRARSTRCRWTSSPSR